ncbi:adenylate cyclase [Solidesulfovibrio carbinoliphilus subsp. oakridgensis]|uniref:Adenylate cyclase n=1 Tax=Solidesulfovibrio carbinoliphilus subsp. oakridgensis TaxID=694327 RepID=G7QCK7_9BACT|nr:CYTH domain-containing protein [Solidesulfovibrio carbinoliphilus]EHJ46163.1 adenylate cyclase [Solidesulfovibrio carbinoliphilus subsp. oakridgensis]
MFEAEIKYLAPPSFDPPGERLPDAVYRDVYFDSPDGSFYASGRELRLRQAGGRTTLTYKNPSFDPATVSKEELETDVTDGPAMGAVLANLGYVPRLAFAKTCRRSRCAHAGLVLAVTVVTVDFAPETFVEIEHLAATRQAALAALAVLRAFAADLGLRREYPTAYTDLFLAARPGAVPLRNG